MVLIVMYVTQLGPNQPNRCSAALPVRARACQIRAPKTHVLGRFSRGPYPGHVTGRAESAAGQPITDLILIKILHSIFSIQCYTGVLSFIVIVKKQLSAKGMPC